MRSTLSACSRLIESASSAVSDCRRSSRIAWAWMCVRPKFSIRPARHVARARAADQLDHGVEGLESDQHTLEARGPGLERAQLVLWAAGEDAALGLGVEEQ